mgnify:CR=1 FL=1
MLLKAIIGILVLLYPVAVYFGLQVFEVKTLGILLLGVVVVRMFLSKASVTKQLLVISGGGILLAGIIVFTNDALYLKLYPVLMNALMFSVFFTSLLRPPSAVERLARIQEPELDAHGVAYTRKVTMLWCVFFLMNGAIALWTVFVGTMAQWTLYNGFISYVLIGVLMAVEFTVRLWVKKHKGEMNA